MKAFFKGKRIIVILLAVIVLAAAGYFVFGRGSRVQNGVIAKGVSVAGVNLGEMTPEDAAKALDGYRDFAKDMVLMFECDGVSFNLDASQIKLTIDTKASADSAYLVGRSKDSANDKKIIKKAKKEGINLPPVLSFDEDKLLLSADEHLGSAITDPSPMTVEIGEDCLVVTNSIAGTVVDMERAREAISKELEDLKADGTIELSLTEYKPDNLTFREFTDKYVREARDAVYTKDGDSHHIEPEVVGISIDMEEAEKIFEANRESVEPYTIPAVITYPEITASYLEDKYVNKIIAKYTTSYSGSSANRCANIALAASKIDGYVLNPGERFSYNTVVGPRTEAAGFKSAHVYVGTKVVDGIGGGICQVSSTLYNAVVLADLKTVTRVNHSIPVNYVPLGRDATVSYGTIDYVFENNKSYPISIKAKTEGTTLTVSIVGTSEMDYSVEFLSEFVSSVPYGTTTTEDETLAEGEKKIVTPGSNGSVYQSYRVYKKDGKEYDRKPESKSRYQPVAAEVVLGTKKEDKPTEETQPIPDISEEDGTITEAPVEAPPAPKPEKTPDAEKDTEVAPEITDTDVTDTATKETDIDKEIIHPEE